jgi:hypothetical protein
MDGMGEVLVARGLSKSRSGAVDSSVWLSASGNKGGGKNLTTDDTD